MFDSVLEYVSEKCTNLLIICCPCFTKKICCSLENFGRFSWKYFWCRQYLRKVVTCNFRPYQILALTRILQNDFQKFLEQCRTEWKVSIFRVFLVRIFPHSDWHTFPYTETQSIRKIFSPNAGKYRPGKLRIRHFSRSVGGVFKTLSNMHDGAFLQKY